MTDRMVRTHLRLNRIAPLLAATALLVCGQADARDSLGVFGQWGAFRDPGPAVKCYAIAKALPSTLQRDFQPYATIAWRPAEKVRGQVHFRLSRRLQPGAPIILNVGGRRVALVGGGGDAWTPDANADAAVLAAMRSGAEMIVAARDQRGQGFSNTWKLDGAATAMDAAAVGCAGAR